RQIFGELETTLATITGFAAVSLQPNSGAQGEYAVLMVIRAFLADREHEARDVVLIPASAHGTNPASAAMAGFLVVAVGSAPHGGGGSGMGPIAVAAHLAPYLPGHPVVKTGGARAIHAMSAAPWGSASILLISYGYIRMLGGNGMTDATRYAILNANYIKSRLEPYFPVLYARANGRVAHEMIFVLRPLKQASGIEETGVDKRLMDFGFHAPSGSFPVAGTLMVEPT